MGRRRKAHRKENVNFRVRPVHFTFAVAAGIVLALLFNPKPAMLTWENLYQKAGHVFFHEESEYETNSYVEDTLAQDGTFQSQENLSSAIFENNPLASIYQNPQSYGLANVLPANIEKHVQAASDDRKWIEIDLSDQKLFAWENGNKAFEFVISSGKPWTPTVTGEFRIWIKLRYANMKGGSKERGDYYFLPNVPYVMYYHKGYGIHGTYWHNNFGTPMSHGCVNLRTEDAGQLFAWVSPYLDGKSAAKSTPENPGTRVVVHD